MLHSVLLPSAGMEWVLDRKTLQTGSKGTMCARIYKCKTVAKQCDRKRNKNVIEINSKCCINHSLGQSVPFIIKVEMLFSSKGSSSPKSLNDHLRLN